MPTILVEKTILVSLWDIDAFARAAELDAAGAAGWLESRWDVKTREQILKQVELGPPK